jgi:hypothetical protein
MRTREVLLGIGFVMLLHATGESLAAQSLFTLSEGLETTWASHSSGRF